MTPNPARSTPLFPHRRDTTASPERHPKRLRKKKEQNTRLKVFGNCCSDEALSASLLKTRDIGIRNKGPGGRKRRILGERLAGQIRSWPVFQAHVSRNKGDPYQRKALKQERDEIGKKR